MRSHGYRERVQQFRIRAGNRQWNPRNHGREECFVAQIGVEHSEETDENEDAGVEHNEETDENEDAGGEGIEQESGYEASEDEVEVNGDAVDGGLRF